VSSLLHVLLLAVLRGTHLVRLALTQHCQSCCWVILQKVLSCCWWCCCGWLLVSIALRRRGALMLLRHLPLLCLQTDTHLDPAMYFGH